MRNGILGHTTAIGSWYSTWMSLTASTKKSAIIMSGLVVGLSIRRLSPWYVCGQKESNRYLDSIDAPSPLETSHFWDRR